MNAEIGFATLDDLVSEMGPPHESIVTPGAYVVEGFTPGIMPEFGAQMTEQQLADLIAFLMAQD